MELMLILWLLCGVICYFIMKSKGYPNDACLMHGVGGILLGFIWLIICLAKRNYNEQNQLLQPREKTSYDDAVEQLGRLAELHASGALTEEEFSEKKQKLLRKI